MKVYHEPPGDVTVLVNSWNFAATPLNAATNPVGYPYTTYVDAHSGTILHGQGNPDTPPAFNGHWITRWFDTTDHRFYYFDPSCGAGVISDSVGYKALKNYEDGAFAGFTHGNYSPPIIPAKKNDVSAGSASEVVEEVD